jgi:hypothetical protein
MTVTSPLSFGAVLNSTLHNRFKVNPATTTGLTFGMNAGIVVEGQTVTSIVAGTVALTDDAVNYVWVTTGGFQVGLTGVQGVNMLYRVTAASGAITQIEDFRGAVVVL